jgi:DHA1 family bicyclomycin/chloramphenicol resistance-like MFS transporter
VLCVRFAPRQSLERLIWFGLALQFAGALLNLVLSIAGTNQAPLWLFGTQMIVMVANAFVMNNAAAGAISVRPEAAGTASGAMGFLQQGIGALVSQFGAYLGGHSTSTLPLTAAIFALSIACISVMFSIVPRRTVVISEELVKKAEEDESGML